MMHTKIVHCCCIQWFRNSCGRERQAPCSCVSLLVFQSSFEDYSYLTRALAAMHCCQAVPRHRRSERTASKDRHPGRHCGTFWVLQGHSVLDHGEQRGARCLTLRNRCSSRPGRCGAVLCGGCISQSNSPALATDGRSAVSKLWEQMKSSLSVNFVSVGFAI